MTHDSVTKIVESASHDYYSHKFVIIPQGISKIEESAFRNCDTLDPVVIPDSVTEIGTWAFGVFPSLREIIIPVGSKDKFVSLGLGELLLVERD